jgi:hypothetical protein
MLRCPSVGARLDAEIHPGDFTACQAANPATPDDRIAATHYVQRTTRRLND